MGWFGTVTGGSIGLILGGPVGAVIGASLGQMVANTKEQLGNSQATFNTTRTQQSFNTSIYPIDAKFIGSPASRVGSRGHLLGA